MYMVLCVYFISILQQVASKKNAWQLTSVIHSEAVANECFCTSDVVRPSVGSRKPCHLCGRTYGSRAELARHMVMHTGEKPYRCHICGRNFTQRGNRKTHYIKVHKLTLDELVMLEQKD